MTAQCTIHNIEMDEKTSKTKFNEDGTPKTYFAHIANGEMCFGENMRKGAQRAVAQTVSVGLAPKKHDTMFVCNAMNNAVAMVNQGIIADESLETAFNRILTILETKV